MNLKRPYFDMALTQHTNMVVPTTIPHSDITLYVTQAHWTSTLTTSTGHTAKDMNMQLSMRMNIRYEGCAPAA